MSALTIVPDYSLNLEGSVGSYILTSKKFCEYLSKFCIVDDVLTKTTSDAGTQTEVRCTDAQMQTIVETTAQTKEKLKSEVKVQTEAVSSHEDQVQCSFPSKISEENLLLSMNTRMEQLVKINKNIEQMMEQRGKYENIDCDLIKPPLKRHGSCLDDIQWNGVKAKRPKMDGDIFNEARNQSKQNKSNSWNNLNDTGREPRSSSPTNILNKSILEIASELHIDIAKADEDKSYYESVNSWGGSNLQTPFVNIRDRNIHKNCTTNSRNVYKNNNVNMYYHHSNLNAYRMQYGPYH